MVKVRTAGIVNIYSHSDIYYNNIIIVATLSYSTIIIILTSHAISFIHIIILYNIRRFGETLYISPVHMYQQQGH